MADTNIIITTTDAVVTTNIASGVTDAAQAGAVANRDAVINVTAEYPLSSGNYYTLSTARVKVVDARKKRGCILVYEIASKVFETAVFIGETSAWTTAGNWRVLNNPNSVGVSRTSIDIMFRKQGVFNTYEDSGVWKIEQFIGGSNPTTGTWNDDANWVSITTATDIIDVYDYIELQRAKVDSLNAILYSDISYIDFINKGMTASTGALTAPSDTKKLTSSYLVLADEVKSLEINPDYSFIVTSFDEDGNVLNYTSWLNDKDDFHADTRYLRIMVKKDDGSVLPLGTISDTGLVLKTNLESPEDYHYTAERFAVNPLRSATVINDWEADKMAHASTLVEDDYQDDGYMWVSHYASLTGYSESISNNNVYCSLVKINPCDFQDAERFTALSPNELVGTWQQGVTSPYDPTIIVNDDNIQYLMIGNNQNDALGVRYCQRVFDKTTETFENVITNLNIRYDYSGSTYTEVINNANCELMVERLTGRTGVSFGLYPIFSGRIQEANGYYWIYLGSLTQDDTGFQGCILKSVDGITWDYVSMPPLTWYNLWEGALSIIGTTIYVLLKADNRYRIYSYVESTDTWVEGDEITGQIMSRPFLHHDTYEDKLYAIYNSPEITNSFGVINRSGVTISVLDQSTLDIIDSQTFTQDTSCQYMSMINFRGTNYFAFTEDRKKYDNDSMKGQISVIPMDFLKI